MQSEAVRVNSLHHQAVRDTAASLRVVGRSSDGVIEAVESTDPGWPLLAVQWHPERMVEDPGARLMFTALVQAAAARLA
jgi:putative glutamine amidotransferase